MRRALHIALASGLLTAAAVASAAPADQGGDARRAAAAELSALAPRIEALKREAAGRAAGPELERLLARAQELATLLDRLDDGAAPAQAPRPGGPDPEELRERADAERDRADRLASELGEVDRRLAEARRRAELQRHLEAVGGASDLFAEGVPRRGTAPAGALAQAPGGVAQTPAPGAPGPAGGGPGSGPGVSPSGDTHPSLGAEPRAAASPGMAGVGVSLGDDASPAELRRRRGQLAQELAALRSRADALEAEARAAESSR